MFLLVFAHSLFAIRLARITFYFLLWCWGMLVVGTAGVSMVMQFGQFKRVKSVVAEHDVFLIVVTLT